MAEGALPEREAPDILSECHPLAAALGMTEVYTDRDSNPTRTVNCEPVTSYLLIKNLCGKRFARGDHYHQRQEEGRT